MVNKVEYINFKAALIQGRWTHSLYPLQCDVIQYTCTLLQ